MEIKIFGKRLKSLRFLLYVYSFFISKVSHIFNPKKSPSEYGNILIIRVDFIGDAVMNTSLISAVKSIFPSATITLLAANSIANIFKNDTNISFNLGIEKSMTLKSGIRLINQLKMNKYDLIFDITSRWWSLLFGTYSCLSARRYDRDTLMIPGVIERNALIFTGHYEREFKREHDVIRALKLVRDFHDVSHVPDIYFPLPTDHEDVFKNLSQEHALNSDGYLVVVPGSQWEVRRWHVMKFAQAAKQISQLYDLRIVITGTKSETQICNRLHELIKDNSINLAGKINIEELIVLIKNSRLLIGNDSGPAHIAAGLKIPVVAVMGTADVEVFKPWGKDVRVCYREVLCGPCYSGKCYMPQNLCLQPVTVKEVVNAAVDLLGAKPLKDI